MNADRDGQYTYQCSRLKVYLEDMELDNYDKINVSTYMCLIVVFTKKILADLKSVKKFILKCHWNLSQAASRIA